MTTAAVANVAAVGEVAVVRCTGDLDLAAVPTLAEAVTEALASRPTGLVLDLTDVAFCDTVGLRLLLSTATHGRAQGCAVGLTGTQPAVAEFLARVCADRTLPSYDSLADAIEGLMFSSTWR
jgi:anti-anti-sigma factor